MDRRPSNVVVVEARYTQQRIPRYRGNPLIEALPPVLDDEALADSLLSLPDFSPEQREWPTYERLQMVSGLSSFLVPLARHLQLARALDSFIRSGYVSRRPASAEHVRIYQSLYEAQQAGRAFNSEMAPPTPEQLSSRVVGMSGTGKTSAIRRIFARYPQVIHHKDFDIFQVPYLHIEAPPDGISVKGLATSILRKIDHLVPDSNYYDVYAARKNSSGDLLLNHAARAMHHHFVGVLVVDEIHNLKNAGRSKQVLMAALVTASNELGVPILFVGTHRATEVLGLDFSLGRRSAGHGFPTWRTLVASGNLEEPGEWEDFITVLWEYQWIRQPVVLTQFLSNTLYACCQGVPDIAIKFLACAQWRAMLDGTETFAAETFVSILEAELEPVKPMLDAMRTGNIAVLERYEDIPPTHLESLLDDALNAYEGVRQRGASVRPGNTSFVPAVAGVLVQAGIDEDRALSAAEKVEAAGKVTGIAAGAEAALALTRPRRATKSGKAKADEPLVELAPDDYRNAFRRSRADGQTVFSHLQVMGAVCQLDKVLQL
ncbi:Transposition protein C [Paraburkholderia ribeironis]|uniref:Transposition protein C n=1 Tax=Paraburkholderia ribeironis TaxID=1247936 RepID=A0A1N7SPU3_9BURK|nr:AAA family ATPase [Paraburkholderia ribeironis]SIT49356.1 Transposition protein C [Paraburkholderia ribeironis]